MNNSTKTTTTSCVLSSQLQQSQTGLLAIETKTGSFPGRTRKKTSVLLSALLIAMFSVFCTNVSSQAISIYTFSSTAGTYTAASGTTISTEAWDEQSTPAVLPIGFSFNFGGTIFTDFGVNNNGWIQLGSNPTSSYTPISTFATNNIIAPFARDLQGQAGSSIQYITTGSAPNRVLTVQWTNYRRWNGTSQSYNFQIKLYETTNVVQFIYGTITPNSTSTTNTNQVGIRNAGGFSNRSTGSNWSASIAGTSASTSCYANNTVKPISGLTYAWTPPLPCTGTPAPGNTLSSLASPVCSGASFTLSLQTATTGSGVTYQWQHSTDGGSTWADVAGATSATLVTSQTVAKSYKCNVTCSGATGTSTDISIGLSSFINCYCAASATSNADEEISNVTFGTLNNSSTCTTLAPGPNSVVSMYSNYASGAGAPAAPNVAQGDPVNYAVTMTTCGSTAYGNSTAMYIDYNQNGSFAEANEKVYQSAYLSGNHTDVGSTTIPLTALTGNTRMRVVNFEASTAPFCGFSSSWGEVEDYIINITPLVSCEGTPNTPSISGPTSACSGVNFTLSPAGTSTGIGITYQWQHSTDVGTSWADVSGATETSLTTNATVNSQFRLVTNCSGSGLTSTSAAYAVNITAFAACTCISYPANYASSTADEEITNVTVGSMNNSSSCATAATGPGSILNRYANYSGVVTGPSAVLSSTVNFSLTQTTCLGNWGSFFQIYMDWNQDGDWLDAGEQVYSQGASINGTQTVTGSFLVPANATVGVTRMRVVHVEASASTTNYAHNAYTWGETEDYCFTVTAPVPPTISSVPASACPGSTVTISGSDFMSITAVTFGGVPATSFTVVNSTTIQAVLSAPGAVVVTNANGSATSSGNITFSESVLAAPVTNVSSVSAQFGQAVTIFVVAPSSSVTYNWYTSDSPTFAFATDTIASTLACGGNIYVAAVLPGGVCESPRTMVSVTIPSYPQIISSEEIFCGVGGSLSLTATNLLSSASILWESLTAGVVLSNTTANPTSTTIVNTSDFRLTVSATGCPDYIIVKSIGVYPLPTATVTSSVPAVCPGAPVTINSGLSAGNFSVAPIAIGMLPVPSSAVTLVENGVATIPQSSGGLDDGGWGGIPIGFTFNYFGTDRTNINVGTNMTMHLGTYSAAALGDFTFTTFPSLVEPASVIAVSAHDINFAASTVLGVSALNGSIKYWTQGYAPNRRFILQYENARAFNSSGGSAKYTTAQVHFLETLGAVEIHIPLSQNSGTYNKVVGLQDSTQTIGAVAISTVNTITNQAWRFSPPSNYLTIWTANGAQILSGVNIFSPTVSQTDTTLYDISYTNQTTLCSNEPNSAQITVNMMGDAIIGDFAATATVASICPGIAVPLSHTYVGSYNNSGLSYQWESSVNGGAWSVIAGATLATYSAVQSVSTSYRVSIQACSAPPVYSSPVAISVLDFMTCYCTPVSAGGQGALIDQVSLSAITNFTNNSSASNPSASPFYTNYSALPNTPVVEQGSVMNLSLTINAPSLSYDSDIVSVWIDYNHNAIFDASEWTQFGTEVPAGETTTVGITIPQSASSGNTKMRIRTRVAGNPNGSTDACTYFGSGETEDYMVNIVTPLATPAPPLATNFGVCQYGDTISMVGTAPSGVTYYWQTTANGTSLDNSASTWIVYGNGTYYIRAYRSEFEQWTPASSVTINSFPTITPPMPPENLSGTPYCAAVTLQAGAAQLATTYYWQGTNPIGTSIALPATVNATATASGTYYIAARNDTTFCWSAGTSISVVVYPAPTGTAVALQPASCLSPNGSVLFNVSGASNMFEYSIDDNTWTTANPISAALGTHNASVRYAGVGGCVVSLGSVTIAPFSINQVSISAPDVLACSGEAMTINAVVTGLSNNLTYQWQSSVDNGVTWDDIAGATSTSVSATQTEASLYRLGASYCLGEYAYTSPLSIAMDYIAEPTITVSSSQTSVCYGTPVTFTANVANEGTLPSACNYTFNMLDSWGDGWNGNQMRVMNGTTVVATLTGPADLNAGFSALPNSLAQTVLLQSGLSYTFQWTTAGSFAGEVGVSVVDPSGTTIYNMPYLSSTLSGDTLTTIAPNCSSSQIAWQVNGLDIAGANALTYTTSSLINTDVVTASVKVLLPCLSETVVSPPAALVVAPALIPTLTVVSSASTVCQGTSVTFTASGSPSNVGGPGTSCNYTFNMFDSYGDGWNGNQMRVMNGTTVVATLTGPANSYPEDGFLAQTVSLQSGISYSLVWNTAGGFPQEVGLSVVNASGVTVYSMDFDNDILAGTTLTTISADCPVPSTYQWRINGSPIAGVTGETYTSSALSPTDVLTVSYSTNAPCYSTVPVVDTAALVVVANTVVTTPVTATYSYTWADNGQAYTESGLYSGSTTNCVMQKLNLTILQPTVTFQVDMAQSNAPAGAIPYVNGTYNNWCGACNPMTNIGGSVWSLTIPLPANSNHEYKFTFNGWDGAENLLAGSSCTVTNWGNTNRPLAIGTTDMVLPLVCWNSCSACGPQSLVKFQVDMGLSGAPAGVTPAVNGSFNAWCGACNTMTNVGGTIWETTILLPNGPYEYKFTYNGWAGQEALTPGSACTNTTDQYTNRTLSLMAGSTALPFTPVVLPMVCWNSCSACVYPPSIALQLFLDGYYINPSNPPSMRAARYINLLESGSQDPGAVTDVDVITVELRDTSNLDVAAYSVSPILQSNGSALCVYPLGALVGSYYVVVNHRASNPLWSANPITLTSSSTLSFASNASNAYNDGDPSITPMHTIASGLYGVWLGELNGDDFLDNQDYPSYEADTYSSGYLGLYMLDGDLNGDAYVDATDYAVYDFNSSQGTYTQRPPY